MKTKIASKNELAKILSKLEGFYEAKVRDEQYPTDYETAAELLWMAYLTGDCEGKVIIDLGCGNGQLGIGALMLGAMKVIFIDKDKDILKIAENNYKLIKNELSIGESEFFEKDVGIMQESFNVDVLLQNPPFGTKQKHADVMFLKKAMTMASVIYTIHKASTREFINKFINKSNYMITHYYETEMPLKKTMQFHKSRKKEIKIGVWRIQKP